MTTGDRALKVQQYTIAASLFDTGFPAGGGPCRCSSACCEGGVFADVREREQIMAHREMIARYMDATQTTDAAQWFEDRPLDDPDFGSGRCVGTRTVNDKCAFLDGMGRCSLQVAASAEGMHKWALKPLFCVLYPIEITNGTVSFDPMLQDEQTCCSVNDTFDIPLFEGCREELIHLLGEEGFNQMQRHYATLRGPEGSAFRKGTL